MCDNRYIGRICRNYRLPYGQLASESVLLVLENLPNIELVKTYCKFNMLKDEDDNKFVDCAIACNASFIVSHDRDFRILKSIKFPSVEVIDIVKFKQLLNLN